MGTCIDLFIDIDETLVYSGGAFRFEGVAGFYRLAHGAMEFLVALDRIPGARISFFSAGAPRRNRNLIEYLAREIKLKTGHELKKFDVFSLGPGKGGKKRLSGLKGDLDMENAIMVDDTEVSADGEERNLLKLYGNDAGARGVSKFRLDNNLVRALGMILMCVETSKLGECTLVEALHRLSKSCHDSREIYERGLAAMRDVNPHFQLLQDGGSNPWHGGFKTSTEIPDH